MRLIDHLKAQGMGNRDARAAMRSGKVWVAGIPTADGGREVDPKTVELRRSSPRIQVGRDPVIVHKGPEFAVVWKPSGMLSVPAPRRRERSVLSVMRGALGTALPVHRLDEPTSGLMMVARTEAGQRTLKGLLARHDVERRYLAIVQGKLPRRTMTVRSTLVRNRGDGKRGSQPNAPHGKEAVTHLEVVESCAGLSLVQATLETGRTHQVRIHLSEQGCPIVGDALYGGRGVARRCPRVALHAAVLGLPKSMGATRRWTAPLADDLSQFWRSVSG